MKTNKIKAKMALKNITQTQLAKNKNVSLNTINNQINDKTELSVTDIIFFCIELEIYDPVEICDIFLDSLPRNGKFNNAIRSETNE